MPTEPLIPNDLSEEQLAWGYWFVTHKIMLRRVLVAVLIVFSVTTLGFSGYYLALDILNAPARQAQLVALVNSGLNPAVAAAQAPRPLSLSNAQVIVTQGKYDFIGSVTNPNQYYAADFTYRFAGGSFAATPADDFILPGEQKFVVQLGVASGTRPSNASLEIMNTTWEKIDRHQYPDWNDFVTEHLNLPISNIAYTPEIQLSKDEPPIGKTSFTITNDTGYGYYGLRALIVMYRGPAIVAINSTTFDSLPPNESLDGEVTWYENYGAVTQIKVFPEVDILNDASYIRVQ
jgi:hypothetical protein